MCSLAAAAVDEPSLFQHLSPNCKPTDTKARYYSNDNMEFTEEEINCLLAEGINEQSSSSWRAQVVVVKDTVNRHKKMMLVDCSQTVNQYTEMDAHPFPRIGTIVNELSTYSVFSTFDLKSLQGAFPYLDNITIAGHSRERHDRNVEHFLEVISKRN